MAAGGGRARNLRLMIFSFRNNRPGLPYRKKQKKTE
nr:MAG TPA: hypothetical protein [Caudoviricetes sp.]